MIPEQSLLTGCVGMCVAMYVAELSTLFSILFSQRCTSSRQLGFLLRSSSALQKNYFNHVERILVELFSNERIDCLKSKTY